MKSAISSGMDFTTSLNSMQAVAGATSAQVAQVGAMARQLGNDNTIAATSSVDAAQAMLELAKGGFSVDQSMQAARGTLQLAAAAQISAGEAATIQSQALQAFGLNANQAGMAADILANSANQSSAEITDVAQALQQSGAVAHQFGLSMNDTAAAISLMANSGIQGSDAGTLLKSALLALTDQSKPAQGAMEELGLTVYDAQGKFVGMSSLFGQLQTASKNMTAEQYQAATATLFGSDAMRIAGIAAQQGKTGFDAMAAAMGKQGAAADVANAKMQGLPGAWERFKNAAQDAGLQFYDAVKGPLTAAANWGASAIGKLVESVSGAGPKVKEIWDNITGSFDAAGGMQLLDDWGERLQGVFESVWGSVQKMLPVWADFNGLIAEAGAIIAAVGIETFVSALETTAGVLEVGVVPILQAANGILNSMRPVVVGAIAAWMGFRLVAPALATLRTNVATLGAQTTTTATRMSTLVAQMRALATANNAVVRAGSLGSVTMGRFGSAVAGIGTHVPVVARMQSAFVQAAAGANTFGRSAGVAAAAATGLKSAGSAVAGVFGGPVGIALAAAATYVMLGVSAHQEATQKAQAHSDAVKALEQSELELGTALNKTRGEMTDDVWTTATQQLEAYQQTLQTTADKHQSTWEQLKSFGGIAKLAFNTEGANNSAAEQAMAAQKAIADLGMTNDDVAKRMYGTRDQYLSLFNELTNMGDGGRKAAREISQLRAEFDRQQDLARRVTPGVTELGEAMQKMGDSSTSAADKLKALKNAMDALNPARTEGDAIARHNEVLQQVAQSTQEAIDRTQGFGAALLDQQLGVNTATSNGQQLRKSLVDIVDATADAAASGANLAERQQANQVALAQLATQYGLTTEQIRQAADQLGLDDIEIVVALKGAPETLQHIASISQAWNEVPTQKTVTVQADQVTDETRAMLQRMNLTVSQPMNGTVTITANDAVAQQRIQMITQNVSILNAMRANPQLDLNTASFTANNDAARKALIELQGSDVSASAGLIIQDLLNGHAVSMTKLDELRNSTANPSVKLLIDELLKNAQIANTTLDQAARTRDATIRVHTVSEQQAYGNAVIDALRAANADGSIRQYANGGINALEQYANGKLPDQAVVQKAVPHSLIQWAEPETGGEAFIPLAGSKRSRSTDILAAVAKIFGYALVPQDNLPSTVSGMLGSLTGNALSRMLSLTGVDKLGVTAYANGGMDAAGLRKLAEGQGASRPLTGAPYVWGGVNWGDCSGAMSAFARAAVGLDPFGGRFATASEGSQLQSMGFTLGQGSSGDLRFGWYNGGAGGGHTAGTLPDGTNIEMGGGNGGGMLGGSAAGADSPQFTDHAFLTIGPGLPTTGTGATDPGGFVTRPDGTIVYQPGNGNYGATGGGTGSGSGSTTGSSGTSISSRFGSAVGAFVEGQIADVFQTLGANDTPGIVGAIADYENAQRAKDKGVDTTALKTSYENAKKESDQKFEAEKLKRKQDYDEQVRKLQAEKKATKDAAKKAEIDAKLADLKKKHEDDELAKKQEHDNNQLDAKQKYDQATKTANSANSAAGQQDQQNPVTDPGTSKPAPGQDLGGAGGAAAALASTGNQIKDAFRSGLREAWRTGQPWTDTDWIVNKESSWKPDARNGKYFGLIQAGAEVYQAAGKSPTTTDPKEQAEVYDKYVGDRYGDPEAARAHHEANNWYDDGGVGIGTGLMAKNVLRPERVLSPRQTESFEAMVRRDFQSGIGTDQIIAKLDQLITVVAKAGIGGMNVGSINGMSPEAVRRELQSLQRLQMMRASQ